MIGVPGLPYPGLRAFQRDESHLFFGREGSVDALVATLARTHFLAVLGASGSGKSSLVRTGLLDALELGFLTEAGPNWLIADFHPAQQPLHNLAAQLLKTDDEDEIEVLEGFLRLGPRSVIQWCAAGNLEEGQALLIFVDQFEELFRYSGYSEREEAEAFVALLLESASSTTVPIYVVMTMRSEFLGACSLMPNLAERINSGLFLTPRMGRDNWRRAIEGPATVFGFEVEEALVNRVLNDMASFAPWQDEAGVDQLQRLARRADQLPLMQHMLNQLYRHAAARGDDPIRLTQEDYEATRGLRGSLDAHGKAVLDELGEPLAPKVQRLMRMLVTGTSLSTAVRRPTRFDELIALLDGDRDSAARIVERLRAPDCNFLQPPASVALRDDTIVDISHESLIRQWSLLAAWLAAEAAAADQWQRLIASAERYQQGRGDLLQGLDLANARAWWNEERPNRAWADRQGGHYDEVDAYLSAGAAAADAAAALARRRDARERNRLRAGVAVLALATMSAGVAAVYAVQQRDKALASSRDVSEKARQLRVANVVATKARAVADVKRKEAETNAKKALQAELLARRRALEAETQTRIARKAQALASLRAIEAQRAQHAMVAEQQRADKAELVAHEERAGREVAEYESQAKQEVLDRGLAALREGNPERASEIMSQGVEGGIAASVVAAGRAIEADGETAAGDGAPDSTDSVSGHSILSRLLDQQRPARMTSLPFYPDAELWEVASGANEVQSFLVDERGRVVPLEGTAESIDLVNRIVAPRLETAKNVTDYIEFFGAHVWGLNGTGPFYPIRNPEQLPAEMRASFKPPVVAQAQGGWSAETLILFNGTLFSADVRVDDDGTLTILSEKVLGRDPSEREIVYRREGKRVAAKPLAGAILAGVPPAFDGNWLEADGAARSQLQSRIYDDGAISGRGGDAGVPEVLGEGVATAHLRAILAAYQPSPPDAEGEGEGAAEPQILEPGDADLLSRNLAEGTDAARAARAGAAYRAIQADFAARVAAIGAGGGIEEAAAEELAAIATRYSLFASRVGDERAVRDISEKLGRLLDQAGPALRPETRGFLRAETLAARAAVADLEGRDEEWQRLIGEGRELTMELAQNRESSPGLLLSAGRYAFHYLQDQDLGRRSRTIEQMCEWAERAMGIQPDNSRMFAFGGTCAVARIDLATKHRDYLAASEFVSRLDERVDRQLARAPDDQILIAWKMYATVQKLVRMQYYREQPAADALRRDLLELTERAFANRPLEYPGGLSFEIFEQLQDRPSDDARQRVLLDSRLFRAFAPIALAFPKSPVTAHAAAVSAMSVATPLIEGDQQAQRVAGGYISTAATIIDGSRLLGPHTAYSRRLFDQCNVYDEVARYHEEKGDVARAAAAKERFEGTCRPLVERLPAAVDIAEILSDSDFRFAKLLDSRGRSREAVPFAERASQGGRRDASLLLADMARNGRGMGRDPERAAELDALAAGQEPGWYPIALMPDGTGRVVGIRFRDDRNENDHAGVEAQLAAFAEIEGWTVDPALAANLREIQHVARTSGFPFRRLMAFYIRERASIPAPSANADSAFDLARERVVANPRISMDENGIAIGGFDPVALAEKVVSAGSPEAITVHDGAIWKFESLAHRDLFVANPAAYVPAFGGYCAACAAQNHKIHGNPQFFERFEDKTYLFSNAALMEAWRNERAAQLRAALENWVTLRDVPMQ